MFATHSPLNDIDQIESELGKNVLEPGKQEAAEKLYITLRRTHILQPDTSNQVARILITYAWKKKFTPQQGVTAEENKEAILNIAAVAEKYAVSGHDLGLYHYVMSSIYRGWNNTDLAALHARAALDYYEDSPLMQGHVYNCLALLFRNNPSQALEYAEMANDCLQNATTVNLTPAAAVIHASEGDLALRTLMNRAQFYYKIENYLEAFNCADEALIKKMQADFPPEDIAYTQMVYGEAAHACEKYKDAYRTLVASYAFYNEKYANNANPNHLRCVAALANTYARLGDYDEAESLIEQGRGIATNLKYGPTHDFVRTLDAVSAHLEEVCVSRSTISC